VRKTFRVFPRSLILAASLLAAGAAIAVAQPNAEKKPGTSAAPAVVEQPGLPEQAGVLVAAVRPGSPAQMAGIVRGDIVLEAGGKAVSSPQELKSAVDSTKPGDKIQLKIRHGDAVRTLAVTPADQGGTPWIGIAPAPNPGDELQGPSAGRGWQQQLPRIAPFDRIPGRAQGASVATVAPGGPADKAGLAAGDVILSVDGKTVEPGGSLGELIAAHKVGDAVTLSVRSPGKQPRDVQVTLGKKPDAEAPYLGIEYTSAWARGPSTDGPQNGRPGAGFGMVGVLVARVAPDSPAAKAGMKERDLITAVEGVRVQSPQSVAEAVAAHAPGDSLTLTVSRMPDGNQADLTVSLGANPSDTTKGYLGISMSSFMGFQGPERPDSDSGASPMMPWGGMHRFSVPAPTPPGI